MIKPEQASERSSTFRRLLLSKYGARTRILVKRRSTVLGPVNISKVIYTHRQTVDFSSDCPFGIRLSHALGREMRVKMG